MCWVKPPSQLSSRRRLSMRNALASQDEPVPCSCTRLRADSVRSPGVVNAINRSCLERSLSATGDQAFAGHVAEAQPCDAATSAFADRISQRSLPLSKRVPMLIELPARPRMSTQPSGNAPASRRAAAAAAAACSSLARSSAMRLALLWHFGRVLKNPPVAVRATIRAWFRIGHFWVAHKRVEAAGRCGPDLGRQGCYAGGGGQPPRLKPAGFEAVQDRAG
jgi:hypothetical protein